MIDQMVRFAKAQHQYWEELSQSGGIAFHIGGHFPGLKLELWAIKG